MDGVPRALFVGDPPVCAWIITKGRYVDDYVAFACSVAISAAGDEDCVIMCHCGLNKNISWCSDQDVLRARSGGCDCDGAESKNHGGFLTRVTL